VKEFGAHEMVRTLVWPVQAEHRAMRQLVG
jgi:hypothetical protein